MYAVNDSLTLQQPYLIGNVSESYISICINVCNLINTCFDSFYFVLTYRNSYTKCRNKFFSIFDKVKKELRAQSLKYSPLLSIDHLSDFSVQMPSR